MIKVNMLFLLLAATFSCQAQNIYSAIHVNEKGDYKKARPKMIIETNTFYGASGETKQRHIKSFDDAGMLVAVQNFDKDNNLTGKSTHVNDTVHRVLLSTAHERRDRNGLTKSTTEYSYDANYFLVRIRNKNAFGVTTMTTNIVNNEKGMPVEMVVTDGAGQPYGKETASYEYDRNIVITSVYTNDGRKLSTDSMKISFINAYQFPDGKSKYNEQGDVVERPNYEYEYKYDQFGNCVEQKIYKVTTRSNGKKKRTIDRIFTKEYIY